MTIAGVRDQRTARDVRVAGFRDRVDRFTQRRAP